MWSFLIGCGTGLLQLLLLKKTVGYFVNEGLRWRHYWCLPVFILRLLFTFGILYLAAYFYSVKHMLQMAIGMLTVPFSYGIIRWYMVLRQQSSNRGDFYGKHAH